MRNVTYASILAMVLAGCGSRKITEAEAAPFRAAIAQYLKQRSMGMKASEFKSLAVSGEGAAASVAMEEAEGLYGVKVTWEFTFRKGEGGWKVESHRG